MSDQDGAARAAELRAELHRVVDELDAERLPAALVRLTAERSGELAGVPGHVSPAEGLERLRELWGPAEDSAEQRRADAWARRSLGVDAEPGDAELLAEVDAAAADKYGVHLRAS
ncbi:hypothetical protein ABT299_45005 [Spirillospora sp. NPDC000708]